MRILILGFVVLFMAAPAFATTINIYDSLAGTYCGGSQAARIAAGLGGYTHTDHASGDEAGWIADLAGADIAVFDVCSNYTTAAPPPQVLSTQLDALYQWLLSNPDHCAIVALWFMAYESSHPIFAYMGVSFNQDIFSTQPLYSWGADPVFAGLPNPLNNQEFCWSTDGSAVNVVGTGEALGGFSAGSTPGQAGLVANNSRHTFYIGETGNGGTYDDDSDGVLDWSELYLNLFSQCGAGPTATEVKTWSSLKSLYR